MPFYLIPASFTIGGTALAGSAGGDDDADDNQSQSYGDDFFHIFEE